jgi:hypothetical protein
MRELVERVRRALRQSGGEAPLLADVAPQFARELESLLKGRGKPGLAESVSDLGIVELCRCADPNCASVYVVPSSLVSWRWPDHGETLPLFAARGTVNVDVIEGELVLVEALDRPDLTAALLAANISKRATRVPR